MRPHQHGIDHIISILSADSFQYWPNFSLNQHISILTYLPYLRLNPINLEQIMSISTKWSQYRSILQISTESSQWVMRPSQCRPNLISIGHSPPNHPTSVKLHQWEAYWPNPCFSSNGKPSLHGYDIHEGPSQPCIWFGQESRAGHSKGTWV